ncbi:MAG: serine/threonine protein kinase [Candidatus Sericytochromatia bacterium]|nr:serine/threonine protein kinase [Candidatus Sericytochromatia bacterium]
MVDLPAQPLLKQRYLLQTCLAQGTDSATYVALDQENQQDCIVKVLRLGQIEHWKRLELFRREARILANLDHPQIPVLLDYFETEDPQGKNVCLVTEKVPGNSLQQRVEEGLGLSEEFCYLIAVQILHILIYLHSLQPPVIHRDIKPSNLLLDENGCIYLIDFGGVQDILRPAGTGGSTVIGTFGFMAPEQYSGRALPQTDLYALGATLVYLLSGLEPMQLPNPDLLLDFRPFVQASERFCNWVEQLILPSLEQRFYSAEEALQVLEEILPVFARTLSLPAIQKATSQAVLRPQTAELVPAKEEAPIQPDASWVLPLQSQIENGGLVYKIEQILAVSSLAVTYKAQRMGDQKPVILKELHFDRLQHWKGYELFEREMKILSQLHNPRTPRLYDFFERQTQGHRCFYMVTSFLAGQSLAEKLRLGWRPTEVQVRNLARQMLDILVDLHEREPMVIHRDIKPSNILVDSKDSPSLVDFGAVQEAMREQGGGGSTVIGTFGYMAPEQFLGQATPQSDLYGLGTTLLHILSGRVPAEMTHSDGLDLKFEELVNCSEGLKGWLKKMVAANPNERYFSAREARRVLVRLDEFRAAVVLDSELPFKADPALMIENLPDKLVLNLLPTYHDYKAQLLMLGCLNLVALPFLAIVPNLGPFLVLALIGGSVVQIQAHRIEGQKTQMKIEVSTEGLTLQAWRENTQGKHEMLETMDIPLNAIESFALNQSTVHNRLQVRVRHSENEMSMLCRSQLPLTNNSEKAQFILQKLQAAVDIYQRRRKRQIEKGLREGNSQP